ncbi:MAG: nickel pincer cofactor biosynthesis protein LarB [Ruminococcus sp.]|nr:nickel pincer cofactor biosynthesis protein LarB [Ruminococcus sp.]
MERNDILKILDMVAAGELSSKEALSQLRQQPFKDMGFARIDTHRSLRQGCGEVIYGEGKTAEQIGSIVLSLRESGQQRVLVTRLDKEKALAVSQLADIEYYEAARAAVSGGMPEPDGTGKVVIATGGTSDIPVAEEAAVTLEFLGNDVVRLYDVGVAGIHRLFDGLDDIMDATVIIAVAGMEGALASVVGGLADCPVIAVPTSVGYGASFGGLSALLSMLNSCASGVSVVNIDNGFGAAFQASMINHIKGR